MLLSQFIWHFYWPAANFLTSQVTPLVANPVALTAWTVVFGGLFLFIATRPIAPERRFLAAILIVLSPAALINTIGGQNGFLTGALVLTGMLFAQRRPVLAGLAIGCLAIKPHLAIVLPFVLMAIGAWRAFATATLTVLGLAIGSVAVLGVEPWQDYFRITGALQFSLLEVFQDFNTVRWCL